MKIWHLNQRGIVRSREIQGLSVNHRKTGRDQRGMPYRMTRLLTILVTLASLPVPGQSQSHNPSGGSARTYFHPNTGFFDSPLMLEKTRHFEEILPDVNSLVIAGNHLIIGENRTTRFRAIDFETGEEAWQRVLPSSAHVREPVPVYLPVSTRDVLLLGGSEAGGVEAVDLSTGETIWSDSTVGSTEWRYPVVRGDEFFYHGEGGVVAVKADTGDVLWQVDVPTASAPLSLSGDRLYFVSEEGTLYCLDSATGSVIWSAEGLMRAEGQHLPEVTNIVSTPERVFVSQR